MKILINNTQYKNVVTEALGVSKSAFKFSEIIFEEIKSKVLKAIKNRKDKTIELKIPYEKFSKIVKEDPGLFVEFPMEESRIDLKIDFLKLSQSNLVFSTGGGAEQIEPTKNYSYIKYATKELPKGIRKLMKFTLSAKFEFDITIREDYTDDDQEDFLNDLYETINHETLHMLEFYNKSHIKQPQIDVSLSYVGSKNYNIPSNIWSLWELFLVYIYYSEPYEMRAMVHELFNVSQKKSLEEMMSHRYWIAAEEMSMFDAESFFDIIMEKIEEWNPDMLIPVMSRMYDWFFKDYHEMSVILKKDTNKKLEMTSNILDLMKKLEPRINKAGNELLKKFENLYKIKEL